MEPFFSPVVLLPPVLFGISACCIAIKRKLIGENKKITAMKAELAFLQQEIESEQKEQENELDDLAHSVGHQLREVSAAKKELDGVKQQSIFFGSRQGFFSANLIKTSSSPEDKFIEVTTALSLLNDSQEELMKEQRQRFAHQS